MRLKDKLIRRNCPSCGEQITLGTSSLNKKINCPKCRQTVIIPGENAPAEKSPPKRNAAKEKRRTRPAPAKEPPAPAVPEEPRIFIQSRFMVEEPPPLAPAPPAGHDTQKKDVVYCLCNGVLKKRINSNGFCSAPAVCCIYANQPGS